MEDGDKMKGRSANIALLMHAILYFKLSLLADSQLCTMAMCHYRSSVETEGGERDGND